MATTEYINEETRGDDGVIVVLEGDDLNQEVVDVAHHDTKDGEQEGIRATH